MLEMSELVGAKLMSVRTMYRNGAEHLALMFELPSGDAYRVSITAERGSDLWQTITPVIKVTKSAAVPSRKTRSPAKRRAPARPSSP